MNDEERDKRVLHVSTCAAPIGDETDVALTFEFYELGTLSIPQKSLAEFLEGLREGFTVVIHQSTK